MSRPYPHRVLEVREPGWQAVLGETLRSPRVRELERFLEAERARYEVYPPADRIFAALDATPPERVRVVILGQDPYHGPGQAHGLAFSVPAGVEAPPSLKNIFRELEDDLGVRRERTDLSDWAEQGVLLLNCTLTVRAGAAASHAGHGWEEITDRVVSHLAEGERPLAWVLWGRHAQEKAACVDSGKHHVMHLPHPSPLSAHRGFFGSRPFSRVNDWLEWRGEEPIRWA